MSMWPPPHRATTGELTACLTTFLALTCGLAPAVEGARLFRHAPIPRHSAFYGKDG